MPFGLTNVDPTFTHCVHDPEMDKVVEKTTRLTNAAEGFKAVGSVILREFLFYSDDIHIFSNIPEKNEVLVYQVITNVQENKLFRKVEKCDEAAARLGFF